MTKTKEKKSLITSVFEWVEVFCGALFVVVLLFTFLFRLVTVDGPSMNNTLQHGDRLIISDLFYTPDTGDVVVLQDATSKEMPDPIIKRVIATEGETVDIDPKTWTVTVTDKEGNVRVLEENYANRIYKICIASTPGERIEVELDSSENLVALVRNSAGSIVASHGAVMNGNIIEVAAIESQFNKKIYKINVDTLEATVTDSNGNVSAVDENKVTKELVNMRLATANDLYGYPNAIPSTAYPHTVKEGHVFVMGDNRNNSLDSRLIGDVDERMILGKAYVRLFPHPTIGF